MFYKDTKSFESLPMRHSNDDDSSTETDDELEGKIRDEIEFPKISKQGYYWIGKEYYNTYVEEFTNISNYLEGNL